VKRRFLLVSGLLAVAAAILAFESPESKSWAASGDVMFYLGTAEALAHGGGYRSPMGRWEAPAADSTTITSHYPPGFALTLSVPIRLGATPETSARLVRAVCFGVTVALASLIVAAAAGFPAGVLAGVLVLVSPFVVFVHTIVFSEPLFLPLVLATLGLMVFAPDQPLLYGLTAGLSVGVRLIGVALTGAGMLWTAARPGPLRARLGRAALVLAPSVIVELAWLMYVRAHHGGDAREFGWYGPVSPLIRKLIGVTLWWFWPAEAHGAWTAIAKAVVLIVFAAVCIAAWRRGDARTRRLLAAAALLVVMYDLTYLVARLILEWGNVFEIRNFSIVDALFAVMVAAALGAWWPQGRPVTRTVVGAVTAVWIAAACWGSWRFVRDAGVESRQWAATDRASPLLAWIRSDANHREIYTFSNAYVWRATHRRTRDTPLLFDADTIQAFGAAMARTHGVLIGWPSRTPVFQLHAYQMSQWASPERIAAALQLPVLLRAPEGTVWGAPTNP
jgi:hypothetical protein